MTARIYQTTTVSCALLFMVFAPLLAQDGTFAYAQKDSFFIIRFDRDIDTAAAFDPSHYQVDKGVSVERALSDANDAKTVILISDSTLVSDEYTITIHGLSYMETPGEEIPEFSLSAPLDESPWWNEQSVQQAGISHHSYWSAIHNRLVGYTLYLPPSGYSEKDSVPVIYFLGGLGNNENNQYPMWTGLFHSAILNGEIPPTAIVFPNPMPASWYENGEKYKTESMIITELIPLVDTVYNFYTARDGRWISGFSMGGYGSLHLAFNYPELFGSVVSYSVARNVTIDNPDELRNKMSIRLAAGERDFYYLTTAIPIYNNLQEFNIPSEAIGLPDTEHSISQIYRQIGINGVAFHWQELGGFNRKPHVEAGDSAEVKFDGTATFQLKGRISDDGFSGYDLKTWWSEAEHSDLVQLSDSLDPGSSVTFTGTGKFRLVLHADDSQFNVTDTMVIRVTENPANKAPVVQAQKDTLLFLPAAGIPFSSRIEDDGLPEGSIPDNRWQIFPVAGNVLTDDESTTCQVSFQQAGKYRLRISSDDSQKTGSDSLYVTVMDGTDPVPSAYFTMDDISSDSCSDLAGSGYIMMLDSLFSGPGKDGIGNSLCFPLLYGNALIYKDQEDGIFNKEMSERTISMWFKVTNGRPGIQTLYDEGDSQNGISVLRYGGFLVATLTVEGQQTQLKANYVYTKGWQHVALVLGNGTFILYLNGKEVAGEVVSVPAFLTGDNAVSIGAALNTTAYDIAGGEGTLSQYYDGCIDEVALYESALSAADVAKLAGVEFTSTGQKEKSRLKIWPNPASGILNIMIPPAEAHVRIRILDIQGRTVSTSEVQNAPGRYVLQVGSLNPGIYVIMVSTDRGTWKEKVMIR